MTIVVQCPHCETKFNLQPELNGKTIRCPNKQCRQIFVVREQPRPTEPPAPVVTEPLPLPDESDAIPAKASARKRAVAKEKRAESSRSPGAMKNGDAGQTEIVEGEVVDAAIVVPPQVKEVVWSEGTTVPSGTPASAGSNARKAARPAKAKATPTRPIRRRQKKKNRGPLILIGMLITIVLFAGGAVVYTWRFQQESEKQEAERAEKEFTSGEYATAYTSFSKLASDYPESADLPKYQFYKELCDLEKVVRNVSNRENPDAATKKYLEFIETQRDSEFANPKTGLGGKILDAGKKLVEDIGGYASDRVKAYQADRANKVSELGVADKAVATGQSLMEKLERFRTADDPPLDKCREGLEQAAGEIKHERDRTAALAKASKILESLSDAAIQTAQADLAAAGFLADPEAQSLIASAKVKLLELVKYVPDRQAPDAPPSSATATLLFVSPIGKTLPPSAANGQAAQPSVFLAVARGILYAIEENTGALLWAVRVGSEITDPPTVARIDFEDGPVDMALVNLHVNGQSAFAGYVLRSGELRWYQKLPAAAAGPAVVYGTRAYLPVRDELGTIYRFDVTTGNREGHICLAQPVGPAAVMRPGTGLLYVAAEARRIFVIDVALKDDLGNLKAPQCVQVLGTGHATGTLRTPPMLLGPDGDGVAERWMILSQAEGSNTMKLRAYTVLPIPTAAADGKPPTEVPVNPAAELPMRGWAWYPPVTDGERVAVVSDAGQFRLFEVKQSGSFDQPIYALPEPKLSAPPEGTVVRGVAFAAEESAFWSLANGVLQKFRLGLNPARGIELLPVGPATRLGEATQTPQPNSRGDAMFLVVRSQNSDGYKAVLLGLGDGVLRWQRQLGIVPATPPISHNNGLLLVSRDGGLLEIPGGTDSSVASGTTKVAPSSWVIVPPPENVTGSTAVVVSGDGKSVYTVTPLLVVEDLKTVPKYMVRKVVEGKVVHEGTVNVPMLLTGAPATLAGNPVVLGDSLLLPLADGMVYRHTAGSGKSNPDSLVAGPQWRTDATATCLITPLPNECFLTSDGSKKISRWRWPAGAASQEAGTWNLRAAPAAPGVLLPPMEGSNQERLLIADVSGTLWLYPNDRGGQAVRTWRPGAEIPAGKPSSPLIVQRDANGHAVVCYIVDERAIVCLDVNQEKPRWVVRGRDEADALVVGSPEALGRGEWAITDLGGRVMVFDSTSAKAVGEGTVQVPGAIPATATSPLNGSTLLTPLSDGSTAVLPRPDQNKPFANPPDEKLPE